MLWLRLTFRHRLLRLRRLQRLLFRRVALRQFLRLRLVLSLKLLHIGTCRSQLLRCAFVVGCLLLLERLPLFLLAVAQLVLLLLVRFIALEVSRIWRSLVGYGG